ncbi:MAG TPA: hypothetical protein VKK61_11795 [Tepidisphaeraceae bacterium]|jgi:hypothetical protein|nr:hypothetical protein [Tepidisphaeraceae bacterium]
MAENSYDCWIDIFELSHYRGRRRRLFGPNCFPEIRSHTASWGINIDSLIVGPEAYVRFHNDADPINTILWLLPRQVVGDIVDLRIDDAVDSIQIFSKPPQQGELGYAAYLETMKLSKVQKNN